MFRARSELFLSASTDLLTTFSVCSKQDSQQVRCQYYYLHQFFSMQPRDQAPLQITKCILIVRKAPRYADGVVAFYSTLIS